MGWMGTEGRQKPAAAPPPSDRYGRRIAEVRETDLAGAGRDP